jgi:hypothetical protein
MMAILATAAVAVSGGFGAAHGIVGPQLELRVDHLVLSAGFGTLDFPFSDFSGDAEEGIYPAGGIRWIFGDGEGPYVSLHAAHFSSSVYGSRPEFQTRHRTVLGATGGWRLRSHHVFLDVGLGVALQWLHDFGVREIPPSGPGNESFDRHLVRPGFIWNVPMPDVDFAVGYEF